MSRAIYKTMTAIVFSGPARLLLTENYILVLPSPWLRFHCTFPVTPIVLFFYATPVVRQLPGHADPGALGRRGRARKRSHALPRLDAGQYACVVFVGIAAPAYLCTPWSHV